MPDEYLLPFFPLISISLLVFTSSVNKSEIYSKLLSQDGIKHTVLNAKNHENEAEIISNAFSGIESP